MYTDIYGRQFRYAPPAGWAPKDGQESIGRDEFQKIVARGFQFPEYDGPTDLCTTKGDCLSPLLAGGRQIIRTRPVAPDEALLDYGLYIIECDWKDKDNPAAVREYCDKMGVPVTAKLHVVKILRWVCHSWWFVCNQAIGELENLPGLIVLAQVVAVLPAGAQLGTPAAVVCDTGQLRDAVVTTPKLAPGAVTAPTIAPGVATQPPISTAFAGPGTFTFTIPSGGKQVMIIELWGDSGLGAHGNTTIPTLGGGGGSGDYCKSQYALTSSNIGQTLTIVLQGSSSNPTASTVSSGSFAITPMSAVGGTDGTAGTASVNGNPGDGGPSATGGNLVNQMGNPGIVGVVSNNKPGPGVTGTYGNGNPGGRGNATASTNNPGGPAICVVTVL